jgi:hypothetical protein
VGKWDTSAYGWTAAINTSAQSVAMGIGNSGSYVTGLSWNATINANTWYHLAYTRSGSTFKIFLNGTQVYTFASSATFTTTSNTLNIGGQAGGTDNFTGYVDDIRFTRGVARYTSNFTAPTSALLTS